MFTVHLFVYDVYDVIYMMDMMSSILYDGYDVIYIMDIMSSI